jgi:hypothetical protein
MGAQLRFKQTDRSGSGADKILALLIFMLTINVI